MTGLDTVSIYIYISIFYQWAPPLVQNKGVVLRTWFCTLLQPSFERGILKGLQDFVLLKVTINCSG